MLSQRNLADSLNNKFTDSIHSKGNFLYVPGNAKVCIVAHLDTVHKDLPKKIFSSQTKKGTKIFSKEGIGADDRCGIVAALCLREQLKDNTPHLLFTYNEEIGGLGVKKFVTSDIFEMLKEKVNCFIEFDRRGNNDYVDYNNKSKKLEEIFIKQGFEASGGSYSDVKTISSVSDIAAINLSIGYYNAHTKDEYFIEEEMNTCIQRFLSVYELLNNSDQFKVEKDTRHFDELYNFGYDSYNYGLFDDEEEDVFLMHDISLYEKGVLSDLYFEVEYGESVDNYLMNYEQLSLFELEFDFHQHDYELVQRGYLDLDYFNETYECIKGDYLYEI